jgi:hypothetical protein
MLYLQELSNALRATRGRTLITLVIFAVFAGCVLSAVFVYSHWFVFVGLLAIFLSVMLRLGNRWAARDVLLLSADPTAICEAE